MLSAAVFVRCASQAAQASVRPAVICSCRFDSHSLLNNWVVEPAGAMKICFSLTAISRNNGSSSDARQIERDRDGLMIAFVEPAPREIQPNERQAQHEQRTRQARPRVAGGVDIEVVAAADHQHEGAEVQHDLRVRQHAARDNPVVFPRFERLVGGRQALGFVRINQFQSQPLADLIDVGAHARRERRRRTAWAAPRTGWPARYRSKSRTISAAVW